MWDMIMTIATGGVGGGLIGSIVGLCKAKIDNTRETAMETLRADRERAEYLEGEKERAHELQMMQADTVGRERIAETEGSAAADIEHMRAMGKAQAVFAGLKTSRFMDNYRGSVRPTLAYWTNFVFTLMLGWAFYKFHAQITADQGAQILIGLIATLTFLVTSQNSFYYVQRPTAKKNI